uniref:cob(I)yrinic acid a,c-diamide adenosyltransferase n=1 Tax=Agathobacter sp. TaxID=2021311 RepID=UPI00405761B5
MSKGILRVYYGDGYGKSTAALGTAVSEAARGKSVTVISFLREKNENKTEMLNRLEPELKFFRFEKSDSSFESLSQAEKEDEIMNLKNGFNYSKKVVTTGGCDLVVLDEILELLENDIISEEAFWELANAIPEDMVVICTGRNLRDKVRACADEVYRISCEK